MGVLEGFLISLDENSYVYDAGSTIKGKVVVIVRSGQSFRFTKIQLFLHGFGELRFKAARRAKEQTGQDTYQFLNTNVTLIAEPSEKRLGPGQHEYKFELALPQSQLPSSFEHANASIRYTLEAEATRSWKSNKKCKVLLKVINHLDIGQPEYLVSIQRSVDSTVRERFRILCCTSQKIEGQVQTDKAGYCVGDSLVVSSNFSNFSNHRIIPKFTLFQSLTLSSQKNGEKVILQKIDSRVGDPIAKRCNQQWSQMSVEIPPTSPSILNCPFLKLSYMVKLTLDISGAPNVTVDLPIVIGSYFPSPTSEQFVPNFIPSVTIPTAPEVLPQQSNYLTKSDLGYFTDQPAPSISASAPPPPSYDEATSSHAII